MSQYTRILHIIDRSHFPDPRDTSEDGILAVGGVLEPDLLWMHTYMGFSRGLMWILLRL